MRRLLLDLDALAPDERGRVFEHLVVPWLLRHSPLYSDVLSGVWQWDEYRERHKWGSDLGIDLIAEERTGRLWAVQAKAHIASHDVTWKNISTFVGAAAARPEVGCLVLITTAQNVSRRARHQLQSCGKDAIIIDREKLLDLGVPADLSLANIAKARVAAPKRRPRPHQAEAIAAIVEGFASSPRGQVIHACGTGKTLTALWAREALGSQRTIVFAPSLNLVDQTLREWQAQRAAAFTAVVVCSDPSIGKRDTDDDPTSPLDLIVPPTTDASQLRKVLQATADAVVVFATYQSSAVVKEALSDSTFRFDLLIADEAHRTTGAVGGDFSRPLDDAQIGSDRRLFFTATPRTYRARKSHNEDGDSVELVSMDEEAQFGPRFHSLTFRDAIERALLSDYRILIFGVMPGEVARLVADRAYVTHDGSDVTDATELATHVGLARAMREFEIRRTISFHNRVSQAGVFADRFLSVLQWLPPDQRPDAPVWTAMLSGKDSIYKRRKVLGRLQAGESGEYGLVSNARCLAEGVDVPAIDGIIFVDPKSSDIDIVQAVGRALRKSDSKSGPSTIVLPVVVPDVGADTAAVLEGSRYGYLWRVIDALRTHDEVLGEELDALRRGSATVPGQSRSLPAKIILRLPEEVGADFAAALSLKIVEATTSGWEVGFAHLEAYYVANRNACVPYHYKVTSTAPPFPLGRWVSTQRKNFRTGALSRTRFARLSALSFVWDAWDASWEEGYSHLLAFRRVRGNAVVLRNDPSLDRTFPLGKWVQEQRKAGTAGKLTADRRARLDELDFVWNRRDASWERGYAHLQAYIKANGDSLVPTGYEVDSVSPPFQLGLWVANQRNDAKRGELTAARRARLECLGFAWSAFDERWENGFRHFAAFVEATGQTRVDRDARSLDGTFPLGGWVVTQRRDVRRGRMTSERRARLDALGFDWVSPKKPRER